MERSCVLGVSQEQEQEAAPPPAGCIHQEPEIAMGSRTAMPSVHDVSVRGVFFGSNVKVVEPANLYDCNIGDDCFIGPFVEIQRGAVVGARTRVQSHSFICELVTIGEDCFVGHGVMFVNDTFSQGRPAGGNRALWKDTCIGDEVLIGSNATILPVKICSRTVIGAGSVVTKDIDAPGIYAGNPARLLRPLP
jgi:carbonic anhydrase/acetyltransferase-like protein (isoleucine patch superfamily)